MGDVAVVPVAPAVGLPPGSPPTGVPVGPDVVMLIPAVLPPVCVPPEVVVAPVDPVVGGVVAPVVGVVVPPAAGLPGFGTGRTLPGSRWYPSGTKVGPNIPFST